MSSVDIMAHAQKMTDAINCLREQGHHTHAVILMHIAIDQFAWSSIANEKSEPKDFQNWVNDYMISKNPIGCTAEELWASRNGLIHMGTAESAAHASGKVKNKIYYTVGNASIAKNALTDVIFVNAENLLISFITGLLWFIEDLKKDSDRLKNTNSKLNRMLTYTNL
jgi:hypothetical protein|nr:hypothetical protein [uncultured Pseudomonas sp.]